MTKNDGGPAFPRSAPNQQGMSLRDYFAAKFLTTIAIHQDTPMDSRVIAKMCYVMADAMIEERNS